VDEDGSGEIEFSEFIKVIEKQKADAQSSAYDSDTLEAFVALGGNVRSTLLQPVQMARPHRFYNKHIGSCDAVAIRSRTEVV